MDKEIFFQEILKPEHPLLLRDGSYLEASVYARRSRLYPGHVSLISEQRLKRSLPESSRILEEERIDPEACRFCHPETLCMEDGTERKSIFVEGEEFLLARNPFYYLPGHSVLFPKHGPHRLADAGPEIWRKLITAGIKTDNIQNNFRLGFNAGSYLCCGGTQRHLHLQLVPLPSPSPTERAISESMIDGASYEEIRDAFHAKDLIVEETDGSSAFLAACWAPRFNLELVAVFAEPKRFHDMKEKDIINLANWIYGLSSRFVQPQGGGVNGYGLETPNLPFMVRIIPRLPGAVQAFMETGAGYMVISYLPEAIPRIWTTGSGR